MTGQWTPLVVDAFMVQCCHIYAAVCAKGIHSGQCEAWKETWHIDLPNWLHTQLPIFVVIWHSTLRWIHMPHNTQANTSTHCGFFTPHTLWKGLFQKEVMLLCPKEQTALGGRHVTWICSWFWVRGRAWPAATLSCHSTKSCPVMASVTGCSTCHGMDCFRCVIMILLPITM